MTLTEIANRLGTDKGTKHFEYHSYTETYQELFHQLMDKKIKMLEIGVADPRFPGASIQMWTEFFSNIDFIGFDINPSCKNFEKENVRIFIGDQSVSEDLERCVVEYGGDYDIIIDDGLHTHLHQTKSFESLYPHLKVNGLYIIEDLHAYDCAKTIEWFKERNIPFELHNNNKLLIHKKEMNSLNLIWQTFNGDQTTFEFQYTTEVLFKDFEQNRIFDDGQLTTVLDNSVIIYSNNSNTISEQFNNYLNKFVENGYKFYLLHFSNENLGHNCEYYSKANHVFRNYYDSNITNENITFIPLGVKTGFIDKDNDKTSKSKEYEFAFIGQPKSDRQDLLSVIENMENVFIHKTNSWNCSTSLTQDECVSIYNKTKFVPCPMGWVHPDSFRLMECLESGSIPILKNYNNLEYFTKIWGESPIPVINSWDEIVNYSNMENNKYNELYKDVFDWYSTFKSNLSTKIKNNLK
jgi:hypothetical protein